MGIPIHFPVRRTGLRPLRKAGAAIFALLLATLTARAEIQFDVFFGFKRNIAESGSVHEAAWFPAMFELHNDAAAVTATIELSQGGDFEGDQVIRSVIELPADTTKKLTLPVFQPNALYTIWQARLVDESGTVLAEQRDMQPHVVDENSFLGGALPRTHAGTPVLPKVKTSQAEYQPTVAELLPATFPDSALALEGMNALYINSERLVDLAADQIQALLLWLHAGGHLILAVEQPGDVNAFDWVREILPLRLESTTSIPIRRQIHRWLTNLPQNPIPPPISSEAWKTLGLTARQFAQSRFNGNGPSSHPLAQLPPDREFDRADLVVSTGWQRDGTILLKLGEAPLAVRATRGRGQITLLTFSPERQPFLGWSHRNWFWAVLFRLDPAMFQITRFQYTQGLGHDGIFAAMIESRQVRKLPVSWLIALLFVYLVVIGPVDYYLLKRWNRPMFTWITFPLYVVVFSFLIYFIGYRLRAGDTEWNALHIVDVLPKGYDAEWRGHSYLSIYSPLNAWYELHNDWGAAAVRSELSASNLGGREAGLVTRQEAIGFQARAYVPVWSSRLLVSDWYHSADMPFRARILRTDRRLSLEFENLKQPVDSLLVVADGRVFPLENVPAFTNRSYSLVPESGQALGTLVSRERQRFYLAAQQRRRAFGGNIGRLARTPMNCLTASFLKLNTELGYNETGGVTPIVSANRSERTFTTPPGTDLSAALMEGKAVVFAWYENHAIVPPIRSFPTRHTTQRSLVRMILPIESD